MRSMIKQWYTRAWAPLKKWTGALLQYIRKNDDNDDQFNHPYIIF